MAIYSDCETLFARRPSAYTVGLAIAASNVFLPALLDHNHVVKVSLAGLVASLKIMPPQRATTTLMLVAAALCGLLSIAIASSAVEPGGLGLLMMDQPADPGSTPKTAPPLHGRLLQSGGDFFKNTSKAGDGPAGRGQQCHSNRSPPPTPLTHTHIHTHPHPTPHILRISPHKGADCKAKRATFPNASGPPVLKRSVQVRPRTGHRSQRAPPQRSASIPTSWR